MTDRDEIGRRLLDARRQYINDAGLRSVNEGLRVYVGYLDRQEILASAYINHGNMAYNEEHDRPQPFGMLMYVVDAERHLYVTSDADLREAP